MLAAYGAVAGLLYGLLMNLWLWPFAVGLESELSYVAGAPLSREPRPLLRLHLATSLGFDIPRAVDRPRARRAHRAAGPARPAPGRPAGRSSARSATSRTPVSSDTDAGAPAGDLRPPG